MATEGFLVYIALFLGSVHGTPESWTPDSDRMWIQHTETETTHLTNPNPPTSVHLTNVTDSSAVIIWERPSSDSDPNSEQYTYVVEVQSLADGHTMQFMTNYTKLEITHLNSASRYKVSVSSAIKGVKSLKSKIRLMETTNLCPNFIAPEGTRVVDEKMTRHGPVVVIECRQGYRSTSSLEIPCLGDIALRPCVPKSCAHQGEVFDHGEIIHKKCFDLRLESICQFGDLIPPIVTCCHPIPQIADGSLKYLYRQHPVSIAAEYDCNTGYDLSGPHQFHCNHLIGQWSSPFPLLPSCVPITCLAPPKVNHGKLLVIRGRPGQYKEGDVLRLVCDDLYRPSSVDLITCHIGKWTLISSGVPSVQLVNVISTDSRLHGLLQKWDSGSWSSEITTTEPKHLAEFSCEERGLKFRSHIVSRYRRNVRNVEWTKLKLETSRGDYIGRPEGNSENEGWKKICIEDKTAAQAFCRKLFPDQTGWTTRVLWDSGFHSGYSYRCDGGCRFETESRMCYRQIQCRATCDPLSVPNGQVRCHSVASEGEWCNVHCNRLYRLEGDDTVQCRSDGWSGAPYCIETGECGYSFERGPHSVGCLTKLWTEVGCRTEANLSPTRRPDYWLEYNDCTVSEVKEFMAGFPRPADSSTYNPNCQVDNECFPGHSTVLTVEGSRKSMSELRLGDRVLSLGADGRLTFSEVILWLDRRPTARERYVVLSTEGSPEPLTLSADHVTFIAPSNATAASSVAMVPVLAKDLRRGHLLYRLRLGGGALEASRVTDVRESEELGAYAPMTVEGNLIVDGHLASCYALQCRQYLAHLPFAPYRLLHYLRSHVPLFERLFPIRKEQEDEGVHWYAAAWHKVGQWFGYPFGKTCYPTELQLYHYPEEFHT